MVVCAYLPYKMNLKALPFGCSLEQKIVPPNFNLGRLGRDLDGLCGATLTILGGVWVQRSSWFLASTHRQARGQVFLEDGALSLNALSLTRCQARVRR
jgi:hypothetical protein